jgi:hypothetical protein
MVMWTRGKDSENPGKFSYTLYTPGNIEVETRGGFDTAQEADRASEGAQRLILVGMHPLTTGQPLTRMGLDQLRSELQDFA